MAFRFEDLKVWHKAVDLSNDVDLLVKDFPKAELYSLASQMKRAAVCKMITKLRDSLHP